MPTAGHEQWTCSEVPPGSSGHVPRWPRATDIWQVCPLPAATDGHIPLSCWQREDMSFADPKGTCPPRPRPLDMPSNDREHRTYGNYVHSGPRAMDMFRSPDREQWTCSEVPPGNSTHAPRWPRAMDIWQLCPFPAASNGHVPESCSRTMGMSSGKPCALGMSSAHGFPGRTSSARRRGSGCATDPRSAVRRRCGGIRRRRP